MARNLSIRTEPPEVLPDETPHGCYDGWIYMGFEGEDKTGEHVEFTDKELIELRNKICRERGWDPVGHRFQIYAISPEGRRQIERNDEED
jgi:hypothetical protein